jgi:hypothetical protein
MRKLKGLSGVGICSLCGEWHSRGEYFPSGEKNRRTGETPHDNFVCELCQKEIVAASVISDALDAHEKADRKRPSGQRIKTALRAA